NFASGGDGHGKVMALGAVESDLLAWCQIRVPVVLVARPAEPGAAKCAFGHVTLPPRRSAFHVVNAESPDKIPMLPPFHPRRGRRGSVGQRRSQVPESA